MKLNDRILGILAIVGGVLIYLGTLDLREVPGQALGSAFFPQIVAGIFVMTGAALTATAGPGPLLRLAPWMWGKGVFSAAGVVAAVLFWLFAVNALGFLLTTWLMISALAMLLGGRILTAAAAAAVATVVFYLIFVELLRVPLPRGVVEALLP